MRIDERIVINKPKIVRNAGKRRQAIWTRQIISAAVWKLRCRILDETGEDILHVFTMTDCIEFSLRGVLETLEVPGVKRKLKGKPAEDEEV